MVAFSRLDQSDLEEALVVQTIDTYFTKWPLAIKLRDYVEAIRTKEWNAMAY